MNLTASLLRQSSKLWNEIRYDLVVLLRSPPQFRPGHPYQDRSGPVYSGPHWGWTGRGTMVLIEIQAWDYISEPVRALDLLYGSGAA